MKSKSPKWERKARKLLSEMGIAGAQFGKNGKFIIVGIAVENIATGEGALISGGAEYHNGYEDAADIVNADVSADIFSDAMANYNRAVYLISAPAV